jgi:hypothetical protein
MVWVGDRSYGWYLWHWPAIVFAAVLWPNNSTALVLAGVGSLVPTMASYHFVEQPIRFNRGITGARAIRVALVCILVPFVVCFGLGLSARTVSKRPTIRAVANDVRAHADVVHHCDSARPIAKRRSNCTWTTSGESRGTVWLVGDSNAGQITEPVQRAANADGFNFTVATDSLCPFVDLVLIADGAAQNACHRFVDQSLETFVERRPTVVVLAASSTDYINNSRFRLRDPKTHTTASTPATKAVLWRIGLQSVLDRLSAAGTRTIVVNTVPHFGTWTLLGCPAFRLYSDVRRCGETRARSAVRHDQAAALQAENAAVAATPKAVAVDFSSALCNTTTCSTNRGRLFLYRDAAHLGVDGALTLTARFEQLVKTVSR